MDVTLWKNWQGTIGKWQAPVKNLGGWSLDIHHSYDPAEKVLYLGDGSIQSAQTLSPQISTTAGNGQAIFCLSNCGDGGPATKAAMEPVAVAIAPDGSQYIADWGDGTIRKVDPSGTITTLSRGPFGNGWLSGIALGPDGSVYAAAQYDVYRIDSQGNVTTVAGTGSSCGSGLCGDGGPAIQASLGDANGIVVGPDGSIYIADTGLGRVRKIDPAGDISTVAGGGTGCGNGVRNGDGCPAEKAPINGPKSIAIGPNGSLYIAESVAAYGTYSGSRIRKVGLDGIITTVAGDGNVCSTHTAPCGDGGLATQAQLYEPTGVAVASDGTIYFLDQDLNRLRKVDPSGIISTVAGSGQTCQFGTACGDGGPAAQGQLNSDYLAGLPGIAVGPDQSVYIADAGDARVRRVAPPLPALSASNYVIPSEDGSQVFVFDSFGRHLQTFDALIGNVIYTFGYNAAGLLTTITEVNNNVTTIERDASGNPTAILGPFGQRTTLTLDANGYLASIADPLGHTTHLRPG